MAGLILETETETITYAEDGHSSPHNTTFVQRRSLDTGRILKAPDRFRSY